MADPSETLRRLAKQWDLFEFAVVQGLTSNVKCQIKYAYFALTGQYKTLCLSGHITFIIDRIDIKLFFAAYSKGS